MKGFRRTCAAVLAAAIVPAAASRLTAQAKQPSAAAQKPAATAPTKFIPPIRGQAELGYLRPTTKRAKDEVITTIQVKNLAPAPIAGLKVEEFWYDKEGNPVTGSDDRLRTPLQPGQTATLTLKTPYNAKMNRNNYIFSHANGSIKTKPLKTLQ